MKPSNGLNPHGKHAVPQLPSASASSSSRPAAGSSSNNNSSGLNFVRQPSLYGFSIANSIATNNVVVNNSIITSFGRGRPCQAPREVQDKYMPITKVIKIMRHILPINIRISDDATETILKCVSEFIGFITSKANGRCQQELRMKITADDILWAMRSLGFDNYVEPLSYYLHRYRETKNERLARRNRFFTQDGNAGGGAAAAPMASPPMPPLPLPSSPCMPLFPTGTSEEAMCKALLAVFAPTSGGDAAAGDSQNDHQPNFNPYSYFK